MSKYNVSELDVVAGNNADIAGVSILGTGLLSTADDSFRNTASFLAKWWDDIGGVNTVTGTGDAIAVTTPTVYTALKTGMRLQFIAGAANTTAATLNLDAIGAKALRKISGGTDVALVAGDIPGNKFRVDVGYDAAANSAAGAWIVLGAAPVAAATTSASGIVELATVAEALTGTDAVRAVTPAGLYYPTGHLFGLTLTNSGSDSIVIAAGTARDSTDTANIAIASALTKSVASAWAVGSGNGGLDTGAVGNNKYYIWGIRRSDTAVCDALFSLSNTAPTMPTNYDTKVLIGEVIRAAAANGPPMWYGPKTAADNAHLGGLKLLTWGTISAAATLDIVLTAYTVYRGIRIVLANFIPATDAVSLSMRFSTNGGSSYDAGATDYMYALLTVGAGIASVYSVGDTLINLGNSWGNGAAEGGTGSIDIFGQTSAVIKTRIYANMSIYANNDTPEALSGMGLRNAAQDTDAVRFLFSSGNIASGTYAVYGYV